MNNLKKSGSWKIKQTRAIDFASSEDTDDERVMHSKNDNIEAMIYDKADEVIQELLESLLSRCQIRLETSMKGSDFTFGCVNLLHYKYHKINLKHGESYIDSPDWIENIKTTNNLISTDDKCFQYAATVALNHDKIGKKMQRI